MFYRVCKVVITLQKKTELVNFPPSDSEYPSSSRTSEFPSKKPLQLQNWNNQGKQDSEHSSHCLFRQ